MSFFARKRRNAPLLFPAEDEFDRPGNLGKGISGSIGGQGFSKAVRGEKERQGGEAGLGFIASGITDIEGIADSVLLHQGEHRHVLLRLRIAPAEMVLERPVFDKGQKILDVSFLAIRDDEKAVTLTLQFREGFLFLGEQGARMGGQIFVFRGQEGIRELLAFLGAHPRSDGCDDIVHLHAHEGADLRARQGKGRAEDLLAGLGPSFRDGEGSIPQGSVEIKEKGNAFHDFIIDHSRIARTYAN